MAYKKGCGFKNIGLCTFREEHCRPKEKANGGEYCDLFTIPFNKEDIGKDVKKLQKEVIQIEKERQRLKREAVHKTDPERYKAIKKERKDKVKAWMLMCEAYKKARSKKYIKND